MTTRLATTSLLSAGCLLAALLALPGAGPGWERLAAQAPAAKADAGEIVYWQTGPGDNYLVALSLKDKSTRRLTAKVDPEKLQPDPPVLLSPNGLVAAYAGH